MDDKQRAEQELAPGAPYFVEVDQNGCPHCGEGRTWGVVGPDGAWALGQSSMDEEDADAWADALNEAFEAGRAAGIKERDHE